MTIHAVMYLSSYKHNSGTLPKNLVPDKKLHSFATQASRITVCGEMAASTEDLFAGSSHATTYALHRPCPPAQIAETIMAFLKKTLAPPYQVAVDIGCGSGQSSGILAPHFTKVLGLDTSEAQIQEAIKKETNNNVEYQVGTCDSLPMEDSSVQLITVSQAAHWFDLPTFYKEVDRVLVPGGVLAMYCYIFPEPVKSPVATELKEHLNRIYRVDTAPYWNQRRKIVDDKYKDITMPYSDNIRDESCYQDMEWTIADMVGYIQSWSGYQGLQKANPQKAKDAVRYFTDNMMTTLKATGRPEETKCTVRWNYFLLMSRKPI